MRIPVPALALAGLFSLAACGERTEAPPGPAPLEIVPARDRPLERELAARREGSLAKAPPEVREVFEKAAAEIEASGALERARKVGARAPDFALRDAKGQETKLSDALAKGLVVLAFYRGVW